MRSFVVCLFCCYYILLVGCSSSKGMVSKPLAHPNFVKDEVVKDSLDIHDKVADRDSIPTKELIRHSAQENKQQDTSQILRYNGMYKGADYAPAIHSDLRKPNYVIIHHTSQESVAQTIRTFQLPHTKVSSHYVIGKDGLVIQMLNDYDRAWHAGRSKWGSLTDINSTSIGIELDNNGRDSFPDIQIQSLLVLLDTLKSKYSIPELNFIGHADIAPTRKNDPNVYFPWKLLAQHGFGVWYNEDYLMEPPVNFNPIDAMKIMGYDMRNPEAAIEAFKRKFIVKEVNKKLTAYDIKVLYDIYRKYY